MIQRDFYVFHHPKYQIYEFSKCISYFDKKKKKIKTVTIYYFLTAFNMVYDFYITLCDYIKLQVFIFKIFYLKNIKIRH